MSVEVKKIWTGSLNSGILNIDSTWGFQVISVILQNGTGTVETNLVSGNGTPSSPIPLTVGIAVTIDTGSSQALIDYLGISTTGVVLIIAR